MKKNTFLSIFIIMMSFMMNAQHVEKPLNNPLVEEWNTPFQTPPFSKIKEEHYLPAFQYALDQAYNDLYLIKAAKCKPTFENTVVALEQSGAMLNRISGIFFNLLEANTSDKMQEIAQEVSPLLSKYSNDIYLDEALFARVEEVYNHHEKLNPEQKMLLEKTYKGFVRQGAKLSDSDKEKLRKISMRLSTLSLTFGQNVLASTNAYSKVITDPALVSGIPAGSLAIAQQKAEQKGETGWYFDLSYPSYSAVMTYADNRALREEMYMHYGTRAFNDAYDNQEIIKEIVTLRHEKANILGYKDYAEYVLEDRMAENTKNVMKLEEKLLKYSMPKAIEEIHDLQAYAQSLGFNETMQRWDFSYYANKYQTSLFQMNDELLKPYFKLENVIEGVFGLASDLFKLQFVLNPNIEVYHPDVKVYEVYRNKKLMAILYMDFHPRDSKRGGAWMTSFREQCVDKDGKEVRPLVSLVMNFTPSTPELPSLLTFNEVRTFMHEFGHGLHGMLSELQYASTSGTSVPRDFVELPSQLLENWSVEKEFLNKFAFHYETQTPIPDSLIDKIKAFDNFQAGYASCRQICFGLLDMMWHTGNPATITDVVSAERAAIGHIESALLPTVQGTCTSTAFSHIFAGGYAAGYYGYKWAEVLDADAYSLFQEKGIYNTEVADSYFQNILSKGGSEKAMDLYVKFRGRKPKIDALLERSGLR